MADAHYEQGGRLVLGASSPNVMHQCRHPESSHFTNLWFVPVMAGQIDTKMSADSTVQRNLQRHKRCSLLRWPGHHGPPRIQLLEDERVKSDMLEWTPLHMGIPTCDALGILYFNNTLRIPPRTILPAENNNS